MRCFEPMTFALSRLALAITSWSLWSYWSYELKRWQTDFDLRIWPSRLYETSADETDSTNVVYIHFEACLVTLVDKTGRARHSDRLWGITNCLCSNYEENSDYWFRNITNSRRMPCHRPRLYGLSFKSLPRAVLQAT